MSKSTFHPFKW